jgi:hypothetical protein
VQVSTCLVDAYEDCNYFGKVSFLVMLKVSKWNRAVIKFCVKLKKTATETFEMLEVHMVQNVYQEKACLNGKKCS